ncbi:LsmAD domain [Carpediemonas membranifera]|uniref:LsmAD domain n=1 Tax=Carpediemonas membranifera TaxID=201153 RepID=A0A8J6BGX9_9EUKA|nr:LsmAD domain [Carpediemonas membranifera]|eukprot:KAG9397257.1 LsmAD domain [Carpediemonas membranifera]
MAEPKGATAEYLAIFQDFCLGRIVEVVLVDGSSYVGCLAALNLKTLELTLRTAQHRKAPRGGASPSSDIHTSEYKDAVSLLGDMVAFISLTDVAPITRPSSTVAETFKHVLTDAEIATKNARPNERDLRPFFDPGEGDAALLGSLEEHKRRQPAEFDQFAVNARIDKNYRNTFKAEDYTVPVARSNPNFERDAAEAARIEAEIAASKRKGMKPRVDDATAYSDVSRDPRTMSSWRREPAPGHPETPEDLHRKQPSPGFPVRVPSSESPTPAAELQRTPPPAITTVRPSSRSRAIDQTARLRSVVREATDGHRSRTASPLIRERALDDDSLQSLDLRTHTPRFDPDVRKEFRDFVVRSRSNSNVSDLGRPGSFSELPAVGTPPPEARSRLSTGFPLDSTDSDRESERKGKSHSVETKAPEPAPAPAKKKTFVPSFQPSFVPPQPMPMPAPAPGKGFVPTMPMFMPRPVMQQMPPQMVHYNPQARPMFPMQMQPAVKVFDAFCRDIELRMKAGGMTPPESVSPFSYSPSK